MQETNSGCLCGDLVPFPSMFLFHVKKKNNNNKGGGEEGTFFWCIRAGPGRKHVSMPPSPLSKAGHSLLDISQSDISRHTCPFAQHVCKSFSSEWREAFFPLHGKFQRWDVKPSLPNDSLLVMARTRQTVGAYFPSWWAETKQKLPNSKRKRCDSSPFVSPVLQLVACRVPKGEPSPQAVFPQAV